MGIAKIARRTFLIGAAAIAGGVAVGYYYVSQPWDNPLKNEVAPGEATFNPWVKIAADDTITVIVPRAEMGQGVQTTLAALVAEELDVALDRVKVEHGPGSFAYYNSAMIEDGGPFAFFDESFLAETMRSAAEPISRTLGLQVTGGSSSTRDAFDKMRKAGAATRHVLVAAAAAQWGVDASSLSTENGFVVETSGGRRASYGSLALAASAIKPPSDGTFPAWHCGDVGAHGRIHVGLGDLRMPAGKEDWRGRLLGHRHPICGRAGAPDALQLINPGPQFAESLRVVIPLSCDPFPAARPPDRQTVA